MEPRIQYAQTTDGVSIAFSTLGEGTPLVCLPNLPFGHFQLEWQHPEYRRWYERLAAKRTLVRYDSRGRGLSERDVTEFSLDTYVLDLEAVVDKLGLGSFAIFGSSGAGPVAIAYASRHPQRVSHLILWCAWTRGSDFAQSPQLQAVLSLMDKDWETFTETMAHSALGWGEGEHAHWFAGYIRECISQEAMHASWEAMGPIDVSGLLPEVKAPTLVLHRRDVPMPALEVAKRIASRIPDARMTVLEGKSASRLADMEPVLGAIDEFLGEGEKATAGAKLATEHVHTILFTDVEGSTALTQRVGDARAREVLREHERMVRAALKSHGGSEVKALGDGFMASFSSATKALECAIAMQRAFAERNESAEEPIRVRVGLNAGEPIAEDDPDGRSDLFGTAVILAARIAAKAEGGEILTSDTVRGLVAGKRFLFADRGDTALRGFEDPVRMYELRWRDDATGGQA